MHINRQQFFVTSSNQLFAHQPGQSLSDDYSIFMASWRLGAGASCWSLQWSAYKVHMMKQYGESPTVAWLHLQNCQQQRGQSVSLFAQALWLHMEKVTYSIDEQA